jgi:hypothetical protein
MASYSSLAFSKQAFSVAAFSFDGGETLTAPSGMRRLMLYQLQEEALNALETKKDEQKQGQEAPRRESEAPQAEPVAAPAARPKRPRRQRAPEPTVHERRGPVVPFRRTFAAPAETLYDKLAVLAKLPDVATFTRIASAKIISLEAERTKRRQRNRRRAAAFLLMAA